MVCSTFLWRRTSIGDLKEVANYLCIVGKFCGPHADFSSRNSGHYLSRSNRFGDDGAGGDDGSLSNINSRQDGRAATNENEVSDFHRSFSPADIICRDIVVCRDDMDFRGD